MFLRRDNRDRAIGLLGALAILVTGLLTTDAITAAPGVSPSDAVHADLQSRCDVVC